MRIGELARSAGIPVETVRYYEREGLLPLATRSEGNNYREYAQEHAERLSFIRHCRSLDMTLDEVRVLLRVMDTPGQACGEVDELLDAHIQHVSQRIAELKVLQKDLKQLRARCCQSQQADACGILGSLVRSARTHPAAAATNGHVHGRPRRTNSRGG